VAIGDRKTLPSESIAAIEVTAVAKEKTITPLLAFRLLGVHVFRVSEYLLQMVLHLISFGLMHVAIIRTVKLFYW